MKLNSIQEQLSALPLGPLRYFASIGSTNEEAIRWAEAGAPHLALVVADEQTAGRGRLGRRWFTPSGAAVAFSLVLHPTEILQIAQNNNIRKTQHDKSGRVQHGGVEEASLFAIPRLSGLAALAVCTALESNYNLRPQIKWPNDVLLGERKTCGVLPELSWQGNLLHAVILGVGINIAPESVPPPADLLFPATCLETELGRKVDRWVVLRQVLTALLDWLPQVALPDFLHAWEAHLAYRGDLIELMGAGGVEAEGRLLGLDPTGSLRLQLSSAEECTFQTGELSLRPVASQS
jgi:BirA family biotin operon repressor/biotin-[acetyl-CoA-carboxylase] ligase